jgi:phospholipid/cholesterol/gamma-HCH transport system permease protein
MRTDLAPGRTKFFLPKPIFLDNHRLPCSMIVVAPKEGTAMFSWFLDTLDHVGQLTLFSFRVLRGCFSLAGRETLLPLCVQFGWGSVPVVLITGTFIGMVLAEQSYAQFRSVGLQTSLGSIINSSVIKELGPVLAGVMLAGRVGSAMAAELATMKVTEQIDALRCLGVDPVQYLGSPRFLAAVTLIPVLTVLANFMGVMGGAFICVYVYRVESYFYWQNSQGYVGLFDLASGLIKPMFFGAAMALISCQRGFESEPGAQGVGRAATRAFVASFVAIIILDFFLAMLLNNLEAQWWPHSRGMR